MASRPSTLRSADTCACRLFSSTNTPGHTSSISCCLVTSSPRCSTSASNTSKARAPNGTASPSCSSTRSESSTSNRPNLAWVRGARLTRASDIPADAAHELREVPVGTQAVEQRFGVELDQVGVAAFVGSLEPLEGICPIVARGVDLGDVVRQYIAPAAQVLELARDARGIGAIAAGRVGHGQRGLRLGAFLGE